MRKLFTLVLFVAFAHVAHAQIIREHITVYPNPAANELQINTICSYKILDLTGKEIMKGDVTDVREKIDITTLQEGVYFVAIYDGEILIITKRINVLD